MNEYVALLRGINVGGKSLVSMSALKDVLIQSGFENVKTYIQSGNILFSSNNKNSDELTTKMKQCIATNFQLTVEVVVLTKEDWQMIIESAPAWWGRDKTWKHNLLVLLRPTKVNEVVEAIGELKAGIEAMQPGHGVIYQSMSLKPFGRTTTGKLASSPIYQKMTVRNYNTATKLLSLLNER